MSDVLIAYNDVELAVLTVLNQTEEQIAELGCKSYVRMIQHTAKFAEFQSGKRIPGEAAYKRDNGSSIYNWDVDIRVLYEIYSKLGDHSLKKDACQKSIILYFKKVLAVLEPWRIQIDANAAERIDYLDEEKIDDLLGKLSWTEDRLGQSYGKIENWDMQQQCFKQSVFHMKHLSFI
jgi:hypothetical protein